jgi:hypothetical protein
MPYVKALLRHLPRGTEGKNRYLSCNTRSSDRDFNPGQQEFQNTKQDVHDVRSSINKTRLNLQISLCLLLLMCCKFNKRSACSEHGFDAVLRLTL